MNVRTVLLPSKVRAVARLAQFFVDQGHSDEEIEVQMLREGIRKLHDDAVLVSEENRVPLAQGKFLGHAAWSSEALEIARAKKYKIDKKSDKDLRHEHVIPVNFMAQKLLSNQRKTAIDEYERQIRDHSLIAVLAKDQPETPDKEMPKQWCLTSDSPFVRYAKSGLELKMRRGDWWPDDLRVLTPTECNKISACLEVI